jgi:hypothetical protein
MRWRAARALVLAYLLCVLAPPVAVAFAGTAGTPHHAAAMIELGAAEARDDGGRLVNHHGGHVADHGQTQDQNQDDVLSCCATFCMNAMAGVSAVEMVPLTGAASPVVLLLQSASGCDPGRIHRPPISLLPV